MAKTVYINQAGSGTGDGLSLANAASAAWFNTGANWGAGAGQICPGDTVQLNGTITTALTAQASGTAGNVTTILFATGAKLSKNTWGENGAGITASGKNYLKIDGGSNGIIEATDNGTGLGSQHVQTRGVYLTGCNHCEACNLTINNIFVRTPETDGVFGGNGVRVHNCSNTSVHDIAVNYSNSAVYYAYGNDSGVSIYNITHRHGANGIVVGNDGASVADDVQIYGCDIELGDDSSDSLGGNTFHADGIQCFAVTAGSELTNLRIFGNKVGPDQGQNTAVTSWIFVEGYVPAARIYNNLCVKTAGVSSPTNGFIYDKPLSSYERGTLIFNNTIVSNDNEGSGITAEEEGSIIKNNILVNLNVGVYLSNYDECDYNLYFNCSTNRSSGADTNGVFADPDLDVNYRPQSGSPALEAGADLSAYFTDDYDGDPRSAPWDIGAFELNMGDIHSLLQTANTDPVTELVRRRVVGSGSLADAIIQHSGPYPQQKANGYEYAPVRGNGDRYFVAEGTWTLAQMQAWRDANDPL